VILQVDHRHSTDASAIEDLSDDAGRRIGADRRDIGGHQVFNQRSHGNLLVLL
jgi:hypothetical protein